MVGILRRRCLRGAAENDGWVTARRVANYMHEPPNEILFIVKHAVRDDGVNYFGAELAEDHKGRKCLWLNAVPSRTQELEDYFMMDFVGDGAAAASGGEADAAAGGDLEEVDIKSETEEADVAGGSPASDEVAERAQREAAADEDCWGNWGVKRAAIKADVESPEPQSRPCGSAGAAAEPTAESKMHHLQMQTDQLLKERNDKQQQ